MREKNYPISQDWSEKYTASREVRFTRRRRRLSLPLFLLILIILVPFVCGLFSINLIPNLLVPGDGGTVPQSTPAIKPDALPAGFSGYPLSLTATPQPVNVKVTPPPYQLENGEPDPDPTSPTVTAPLVKPTSRSNETAAVSVSPGLTKNSQAVSTNLAPAKNTVPVTTTATVRPTATPTSTPVPPSATPSPTKTPTSTLTISPRPAATPSPVPSLTPGAAAAPSQAISLFRATTNADKLPDPTALAGAPGERSISLSQTGQDRIRVAGPDLVDGNGQRFFVAGVNYEGHTDRAWLMWQNDKFDPTLIDQNFSLAENGGYNCLRIFIQTQLRDDIKNNDWTKFDTVANLAQRHHLRLLVTFADYDETSLAALSQIDTAVARHFAGNPVILGYDLRNEPQFNELAGLLYPTQSLPMLQTDELIHLYGERVSLRASGQKVSGTLYPANAQPYQYYIFQNMLRYYAEFNAELDRWLAAHPEQSALDFYASPQATRWQPFVKALDSTLEQYILTRLTAIRRGDPTSLITIGWNSFDLAQLPANHLLSFWSLHVYADKPLATYLALLDHLHQRIDQPLILEEFGYSNSDGRQAISLSATASYETSLWLYTYGRGLSGGFKWMLNNFTIGANPYENNFGLTDYATRPKPAYYAARSVLQLIALAPRPAPASDFSLLQYKGGPYVTYQWAGPQGLFANSRVYEDSRVQIQQADALPWGMWWSSRGSARPVRLYTSLGSNGRVTLNLKGFFPNLTPNTRYLVSDEDGLPVAVEMVGLDGSQLRWQAQAGQIYQLQTVEAEAPKSGTGDGN